MKGTCTGANIPGYDVCGKTGTAQNPHGRDHSAFMGFAPKDNPKIAICVYVENGEWGATYGVPIGALMIEQYLRGELSPAAVSKASQFEHRTISYSSPKSKNEKAKPKSDENPDKKEEAAPDSAKRESVFHPQETPEQKAAREQREKLEAERRKAEERRRAEEARRKSIEERRKAEEQRKKEEEARRKAEIRQNAEIARRKAAEIRQKEEAERERRLRLQQQKQERLLNEAVRLENTVNRMRQRINR